MKHSLETVVFHTAFAIWIVAVVASESNKTRLNTEVETETCILSCSYNKTDFVEEIIDCYESGANVTRRKERMLNIYRTDFLLRNISISNITDNITCFMKERHPKYIYSIHFGEFAIHVYFINFGILISVMSLIATYVVYWLLPDLRNVHGQTLLQYVGCLIVTNGTKLVIRLQLIPIEKLHYSCFITALVVLFTSAASFFWLNVMCFDIWWTLRKVRSIRGNVQQKKRKKFLIYSIYAWGGALVLTSVSAIVDLFPDILETWTRPEFCINSIWFYRYGVSILYFWGPISITIIFNVGLFISTARKIVHHKKDMTRHLKSSDSRCHTGIKNSELRFGIYLKLFIVMGMSWFISIVARIIEILFDVPIYVAYIIVLPNILQGVVIFIILVCKKKIMNLLIKRLGCRFCPRRNVTNSD